MWFDQNGPSCKKFANFMLNKFPKFFFERPSTFGENPLLVALPLPALPFTFDEKVDFGGPNEKIFKKKKKLRKWVFVKFRVSKYQKNRPTNEKVRAKTKIIIIIILNLHTYFFLYTTKLRFVVIVILDDKIFKKKKFWDIRFCWNFVCPNIKKIGPETKKLEPRQNGSSSSSSCWICIHISFCTPQYYVL